MAPAVLLAVLVPGVSNSLAAARWEGPPGAAGGSGSGGNAAEVYKGAFRHFNGPIPARLSSEEFEEFTTIVRGGRIHPEDAERARFLLTKAQPILDGIRPAGSMRRSDFDLDRSQGLQMVLPHLGPMRGMARLLEVQTALAIHDGNWDQTQSSLRSLAALGSHAGQDRMLVSSLAGSAIGALSMPVLDAVLDDGTLTQDRAKELLEGLRGWRGIDPFNFGDATRSEYRLLVTTVAGKNGDEVAESLSGFDEAAALRGMSARQVAQMAAQARAFYERAGAAFETEDEHAARRTIAELEQELRNNPLLAALGPSLERALEAKLRVGGDIAARLGRLEAIAEGRKTALEMANASTWLRRAAAIAAGVPDEGQEALALVQAAGTAADPLFIDRAERLHLGAGRAVREALERGLACGMLDLDVPNDGDFGLSVKWLPGLRAACRMLLARAMVAEAREREELVGIVLGVTLALTRDPSTTRALVARSMARETLPLLRLIAEAPEPPTSDRRDSLVRQLRDLTASVSFGLPRGIDADRDRLSTGSPWARTIDPRRRKALSQRGPDFVLFLQVAHAPTAWFPLHTSGDIGASGELERFDDILPVEAALAAQQVRDRVRSLRFFQVHRPIPERGPDAAPAALFRGVQAVSIRDHGQDLADAVAVSDRLSELATALERRTMKPVNE